jgi:hypothetical protein
MFTYTIFQDGQTALYCARTEEGTLLLLSVSAAFSHIFAFPSYLPPVDATPYVCSAGADYDQIAEITNAPQRRDPISQILAVQITFDAPLTVDDFEAVAAYRAAAAVRGGLLDARGKRAGRIGRECCLRAWRVKVAEGVIKDRGVRHHSCARCTCFTLR